MTLHEFAALENAEFDAMIDLWRAAPRDLQIAHEIAVRDIGQATCMTSRGIEPAAVSRRAVRLGVNYPTSDAELEDVLSFMNGRELPYAIPVGPASQPPELASWLEERGFRRGRAWMKFCGACDAVQKMEATLDARVIGPEMATEFGRIMAEGFRQPPAIAPWLAVLPGRVNWICVMAFRRDKPIAAGALFMKGEHAWVGLGATLVSHRRQGAQAALLACRLSEAAARGARLAVTETGEPAPGAASDSYRNILRAGFQEMYLRQNYFSPSTKPVVA